MGIFRNVAHNRIDCGLQAKPAKIHVERLSCQIMVNYLWITLLNWLGLCRLCQHNLGHNR